MVAPGRKDNCESHNLRDHVSKEILEFAVLAATKHSDGNDRLENGMRQPESVVKNLDFLAHRNTSRFERILAASATAQKTILVN